MKLCAGTCSTANACLLLDHNRKFVGCNVDSELPAAAEADPVLKVASQGLSPKSDISGSIKVILVAKVFKEKRAELMASKKARLRKTPPALDPTQVLPGHPLHFICTIFGNYSSEEICLCFSSNMWPLAW